MTDTAGGLNGVGLGFVEVGEEVVGVSEGASEGVMDEEDEDEDCNTSKYINMSRVVLILLSLGWGEMWNLKTHPEHS